jgi:FAD dependent oxidoreductase
VHTQVHRIAAVTFVTAALFTACGGGSGSSGGANEERSVSLLANTQITPWTSGSVGFRVSPALADGETMQCAIDEQAETPCATGPATGRMSYAGLGLGEHRLKVTTGRPGAMASTTASWRIVAPDVVVYGATPGGITSAMAAARAGRTVVLVEASARLGGMMTGGLAKSDVGSAEVKPLGGITAEFFDRTRESEIETGACSDEGWCPVYYDFEPHIAAATFSAMLAEQPLISVQQSLPLTAVRKSGDRVEAIGTARGEITARMFIDASYEGDLMVRAGITHTTMREARLRAGDGVDPGDVEDHAGYGVPVQPYGLKIDPYVIAGQPASGLIPFVEPPPLKMPAEGESDGRLMAYNYRLCVTDDPDNRVPFTRPADFDPARYEGSARVAVATAAQGKTPLDELYFNPYRTVRSKNRSYSKYDLNGGSTFSTDMSSLPWNQSYPEADGAARQSIAANYRQYIEGLLYFWQTDPRFGALNAKVSRFGYCADEFTDNAHWPYQLYVRETRRMVGEYVMNENDVMHNGRRAALPDSIAMGAYGLDSHIRRITTMRVAGADLVVSEGFRIVHPPADPRYRVAYRSLLPRRAEATNVLNPVTLSATSMAYSSLRMEPTFMVIGQAAGTAAALAIESAAAVQDVDVGSLQNRLLRDGQIIH